MRVFFFVLAAWLIIHISMIPVGGGFIAGVATQLRLHQCDYLLSDSATHVDRNPTPLSHALVDVLLDIADLHLYGSHTLQLSEKNWDDIAAGIAPMLAIGPINEVHHAGDAPPALSIPKSIGPHPMFRSMFSTPVKQELLTPSETKLLHESEMKHASRMKLSSQFYEFISARGIIRGAPVGNRKPSSESNVERKSENEFSMATWPVGAPAIRLRFSVLRPTVPGELQDMKMLWSREERKKIIKLHKRAMKARIQGEAATFDGDEGAEHIAQGAYHSRHSALRMGWYTGQSFRLHVGRVTVFVTKASVSNITNLASLCKLKDTEEDVADDARAPGIARPDEKHGASSVDLVPFTDGAVALAGIDAYFLPTDHLPISGFHGSFVKVMSTHMFFSFQDHVPEHSVSLVPLAPRYACFPPEVPANPPDRVVAQMRATFSREGHAGPGPRLSPFTEISGGSVVLPQFEISIAFPNARQFPICSLTSLVASLEIASPQQLAKDPSSTPVHASINCGAGLSTFYVAFDRHLEHILRENFRDLYEKMTSQGAPPQVSVHGKNIGFSSSLSVPVLGCSWPRFVASRETNTAELQDVQSPFHEETDTETETELDIDWNNEASSFTEEFEALQSHPNHTFNQVFGLEKSVKGTERIWDRWLKHNTETCGQWRFQLGCGAFSVHDLTTAEKPVLFASTPYASPAGARASDNWLDLQAVLCNIPSNIALQLLQSIGLRKGHSPDFRRKTTSSVEAVSPSNQEVADILRLSPPRCLLRLRSGKFYFDTHKLVPLMPATTSAANHAREEENGSNIPKPLLKFLWETFYGHPICLATDRFALPPHSGLFLSAHISSGSIWLNQDVAFCSPEIFALTTKQNPSNKPGTMELNTWEGSRAIVQLKSFRLMYCSVLQYEGQREDLLLSREPLENDWLDVIDGSLMVTLASFWNRQRKGEPRLLFVVDAEVSSFGLHASMDAIKSIAALGSASQSGVENRKEGQPLGGKPARKAWDPPLMVFGLVAPLVSIEYSGFGAAPVSGTMHGFKVALCIKETAREQLVGAQVQLQQLELHEGSRRVIALDPVRGPNPPRQLYQDGRPALAELHLSEQTGIDSWLYVHYLPPMLVADWEATAVMHAFPSLRGVVAPPTKLCAQLGSSRVNIDLLGSFQELLSLPSESGKLDSPAPSSQRPELPLLQFIDWLASLPIGSVTCGPMELALSADASRTVELQRLLKQSGGGPAGYDPPQEELVRFTINELCVNDGAPTSEPRLTVSLKEASLLVYDAVIISPTSLSFTLDREHGNMFTVRAKLRVSRIVANVFPEAVEALSIVQALTLPLQPFHYSAESKQGEGESRRLHLASEAEESIALPFQKLQFDCTCDNICFNFFTTPQLAGPPPLAFAANKTTGALWFEADSGTPPKTLYKLQVTEITSTSSTRSAPVVEWGGEKAAVVVCLSSGDRKGDKDFPIYDGTVTIGPIDVLCDKKVISHLETIGQYFSGSAEASSKLASAVLCHRVQLGLGSDSVLVGGGLSVAS